jgi:hypothetical protein
MCVTQQTLLRAAIELQFHHRRALCQSRDVAPKAGRCRSADLRGRTDVAPDPLSNRAAEECLPNGE